MEVFRVVMRGWKGPSEVGSEFGLMEEDEDREVDLDDMYADEEFDLDGDGAEQVGVGDGEGGERGREGEEVEDRRVLNAALAAICNIVMEFSPLRPVSALPYSRFRASACRITLIDCPLSSSPWLCSFLPSHSNLILTTP
jgi:hypothetical protein